LRKTRFLFGAVLAVGALLSLSSCEWFYALFGDPPTAILVADPTTGDAPLDVTFDLSGSAAPAGVHRFRLDFGDGTAFATGIELDEPIVHAYAAAGTYTAVLELTDAHGLTDHDTSAIVVEGGAEPVPAGPIAVLAADTTVGNAPLIVTFDVSLSSSPNSTLVSFRLDFGDGTPAHVGTGLAAPIVHLYDDVGLHTALLTVTDADGATGTATLDIVAAVEGGGNAPVARFDWAPADPTINQAVTFDADASYDTARSQAVQQAIVVYTWDFGDGEEAATTTETVDHTYRWPGTYTVTLTIYDNDGNSEEMTQSIRVGGAVAYVSSPGDGTISEYRFPNPDSRRVLDLSGITPAAVTIRPGGNHLYVAGENAGAGTISRIRTSDLTILSTVALPFIPQWVACHPDGDSLYVTPAPGGPDTIRVLSPTLTLIRDIPATQSGPSVIDFSSNGDFAYVLCSVSGSVIRIDTAAGGVSTLGAVAGGSGLAVQPDGTVVYITRPAANSISVMQLSNGALLAPIDGAANQFTAPYGVAFTNDGTAAYVGGKDNGGHPAVLVFNTATKTRTKTILIDDPSGGAPRPIDIAMTPGDTLAIVPHGSTNPCREISVVDIAGNRVDEELHGGLGPTYVDVWGIGY